MTGVRPTSCSRFPRENASYCRFAMKRLMSAVLVSFVVFNFLQSFGKKDLFKIVSLVNMIIAVENK